MKKLTVVLFAVAAVMMIAIPAMAVDLGLSGHYRARGWYEDNITLDDDGGGSQAVMDMRFRVEPVFKIHDNLKVTARIDAADNREWGSTIEADQDATGGASGINDGVEDIGLERVYLDAVFDIVSLRVGRMSAGTCGLLFCDSDTDADRIKVILNNINPFYLDFTYQKSIEGDYGAGVSDQDFDAYWLHGFYSAEGLTTGLLAGFYNNKTNVSADADTTFFLDPDTGLVDSTTTDAVDGYDQQYYLLDPYAKGVFGPVRFEAELQWFFGDYADFDVAGTDDVDYDAMRYIVDVGADIGPVGVGLGYAHADGQADNDDDYTIPGDGLGGNDWEPFLILTSRSANAALGGLGNLNAANASTAVKELGFDIGYAYGSYAVSECCTLSAIAGMAWADETDTPTLEALGVVLGDDINADDELGMEFDLGAKFKLMDNLTYDVKAGYFWSGDFYKDLGDALGNDDDPDDTWSVFNSLMVTF